MNEFFKWWLGGAAFILSGSFIVSICIWLSKNINEILAFVISATIISAFAAAVTLLVTRDSYGEK